MWCVYYNMWRDYDSMSSEHEKKQWQKMSRREEARERQSGSGRAFQAFVLLSLKAYCCNQIL